MARRYRIEKLMYWEALESKLLEGIYLLFIYWQWVKVSRSSYLYFTQLPNAGGWLSEGIAFLQVGQILEELTAGRDLLTALSIAEQKVLPGRWWLLHLCNMFTHRLGGHCCLIFLSIFCTQHPVEYIHKSKSHSFSPDLIFWWTIYVSQDLRFAFLSAGLYVFLSSIFNMVMLSDPQVSCWLAVIIKWIKTNFEHTHVVNGKVLHKCHMLLLAMIFFLLFFFFALIYRARYLGKDKSEVCFS